MKIEKAVRTPTIESLVYALVNENMLPNEIKTMVLSLLDDKKLTRLIELIRRLPPEGQTRFLDRADQVRRDRLLFFVMHLLLLPSQRHSLLSTLKMPSLLSPWESPAAQFNAYRDQLSSLQGSRNAAALL